MPLVLAEVIIFGKTPAEADQKRADYINGWYPKGKGVLQ